LLAVPIIHIWSNGTVLMLIDRLTALPWYIRVQ